MEARDLAYEDYKAGMKYQEIADKHGVSLSAVKSWATRDWKHREVATKPGKKLQPKSQPDSKKVATKKVATTSKVEDKILADREPPQGNRETKTLSPFARPGNQNARGPHAPGAGGPKKNKHALSTGEYETVFFTADILDDEERGLLDADYDKYLMQYLLLDTLTIREKRILQRIQAVKKAGEKTGLVQESATIIKNDERMAYTNRNAEGEDKPGTDIKTNRSNSSVTSRSALERITKLEDALTRVQTRKQAAITQLHKMEMDDERLVLDNAKYELMKQRVSGKIDLDDLIGEGDLDTEL